MTGLVPFRFQHIRLKEALWIDKTPYFTRRSIGEWLGYVKPRPEVAIEKIVRRNPYIRDFAVDTKLVSTDGKLYTFEVYSPIGLQLIVMESRQPKAIQFKVAVAHLVWAYMNGELTRIPPDPDIETLAELPKSLHGRGKAIKQYAEKHGISSRNVRRRIKRFITGQPLEGHPSNKGKKFLHKENFDRYRRVIDLYMKDTPVLDISTTTGVGHPTVYRWIRKAESGFHLPSVATRQGQDNENR
jgi:transposase